MHVNKTTSKAHCIRFTASLLDWPQRLWAKPQEPSDSFHLTLSCRWHEMQLPVSHAAMSATISVLSILTMTRDQYLAHKRQQWNDALREGEERLATRRHERAEQEKIDPNLQPLSQVCLPRLSAHASFADRQRAFHKLAMERMAHYELADSWSIAYDRGRARAGACHFASRKLSFSRHLIAKTPKQWMEVILHEIAHAIAGPEHHHDSTWQLICRAIGGSGERYHDMVLVEPKWALECVAGCWRRPCLRRSLLHRKPLCPECGSPCKYFPTRPD